MIDYGDMNSRGYRVEVMREEDGSVSLAIPALPGLIAAGGSFEEAWADLPDVIDLWVEAAAETGDPIPAPDLEVEGAAASGRFALRMPRSLHAALARRARTEGTSINTFCITALTHAVSAGPIALFGTSRAAQHFRAVGFQSQVYGEVLDVEGPFTGVGRVVNLTKGSDYGHAN